MEKIGHRESKWLLFILVISNVCLDSLKTLLYQSGSYAIVNLILSALFVVFILVFTDRLSEGKDYFELLEITFGKTVMFILALILLAITFMASGSKLKIFSLAIGDTVLPKSPFVFIALLMAASVYVVTLLKLEAITRYCLVASIAFIGILIVIGLSVSREFKLENLCYFNSSEETFEFKSTMLLFSEILYYYVLLSHIKNKTKRRGTAVKAVVLSVAFTVIFALTYILCIPNPVINVFDYPLLRLSLVANSSVIFQRLDALVFLMWMFLGFISAGVFGLLAAMIFVRIFGIKNQCALCPVVTMICFFIGISGYDFQAIVHNCLWYLAFVVMPLAAFVYKLKKKRGERNG